MRMWPVPSWSRWGRPCSRQPPWGQMQHLHRAGHTLAGCCWPMDANMRNEKACFRELRRALLLPCTNAHSCARPPPLLPQAAAARSRRPQEGTLPPMLETLANFRWGLPAAVCLRLRLWTAVVAVASPWHGWQPWLGPRSLGQRCCTHPLPPCSPFIPGALPLRTHSEHCLPPSASRPAGGSPSALTARAGSTTTWQQGRAAQVGGAMKGGTAGGGVETGWVGGTGGGCCGTVRRHGQLLALQGAAGWRRDLPISVQHRLLAAASWEAGSLVRFLAIGIAILL